MEKIEVTYVLDFLSAMFDKGHAYSTSKSAKCAMATIVHITSYDSLNKHPLTNKYMTGIFMWDDLCGTWIFYSGILSSNQR